MYDLDLRIPICKSDPPRGLVTGWVVLSTDRDGQPVIDHQDQHIPIHELERAVHHAMLGSTGAGKVGDLHDVRGVGDVVESFVATREKMAALGLGDSGPEGWIVTVRIRDPEVLRRIDSGELLELSIRATAQVKEVINA